MRADFLPALQIKALNISKPILQFYFIFGMNVALDRAITIPINNFEKNPKWPPYGHIYSLCPANENINYLGSYSANFYFIFSTNVALHRAINSLTLIIKKIQNGCHSGQFFPSNPVKKSVTISETITWIDFIFWHECSPSLGNKYFLIKILILIQEGHYGGPIFSVHMKRFKISEPIPWIYFIFCAKFQFFIGNILEHIGRMILSFDMNVALHKFF